MKFLKYPLLIIIIMVLLPVQASAKSNLATKVYLYGFVANFTDSVVYFTDIQEVDSIMFDRKKGFLSGRNEYATQLRDYFATQLQMPHRTCVVSFGLSRKEAEKKYMKLKKLYTVKNAGKYEVRYLSENEFRFSPVSLSIPEESLLAEKNKKNRKEKKNKKK